MKVELIKVCQLEDYIRSDAFHQLANIPISRQRAHSQAANPRALPDDVALILIFQGDSLAGYLGLLPDHLFIGGQAERVAWMSCIWVDPASRGKGIARMLLDEAARHWEGRLLATEFTTAAKKLYDKTGLFDDLLILKGMRAYLRPNLSYLLPKKNPKYKKVFGLLKFTDTLLSLPNRLRLQWYKPLKKHDIKIEMISEIDETTAAFIRSRQKTSLFKRNIHALSWMMKYPWLSNDEQAKADQQRYQFSVYSDCFYFKMLTLSKNNELKALAIIAVRDRTLKVPYIFCSSKTIPLLAGFIEQYMLEHDLDIITVYHPGLCNYWNESKTPFFLKRKFERRYLISKALSGELPSPFFVQDGDGDCAFT